MKKQPFFFLSLWILFNAVSAIASESESIDSCLLHLLSTSPDYLTIGEIKSRCREGYEQQAKSIPEATSAQSTGLVRNRLERDQSNALKPFTLMGHNPTYVLVGAYNFNSWQADDFEEVANVDEIDLDDTEIQFQVSIKMPLAIDLFNERIDLYAAYTVKSFWQSYNTNISSPFRETNHEPEAWLQFYSDRTFAGIKNTVNVFGVAHESNGQTSSLSRSWNKIYAGFLFEKDNFAFFIKPWVRIPESSEKDDNPDLTDYIGHGEIAVAYKYGKHTLSFLTRNNIESDFSHGAIKASWSFPFMHYDYLKGYIQYFSGYGESLIDYDQYVNRVGIGFLLTDIL